MGKRILLAGAAVLSLHGTMSEAQDVLMRRPLPTKATGHSTGVPTPVATDTPTPGSTQTPTPTPTATPTFTACGSEGQTVHVTGPTVVRYGADPNFVTKTMSSDFVCGNDVFGDPAYGTVKSCQCSTTSSPSDVAGETCDGAAIAATPAAEAACIRHAGSQAAGAASHVVEPIQSLDQIGNPVHDFGGYGSGQGIFFWNPDSYYSVKVNHDVCQEIDDEIGQPYIADNGFGSTVGGLESCRGRYGYDYYYYRIDTIQYDAQATVIQDDGAQAAQQMQDGLSNVKPDHQSCLIAINGNFFYWPNMTCPSYDAGTTAAQAIAQDLQIGIFNPDSITTYGPAPDLHSLASFQHYMNWNGSYVYRVGGISGAVCDVIRKRNGQVPLSVNDGIDTSLPETCGYSYGQSYYTKNVSAILSAKVTEMFNTTSVKASGAGGYYGNAPYFSAFNIDQFGGGDYCAMLHRGNPSLSWDPRNGLPGCGYLYSQWMFFAAPLSAPVNADGSLITTDPALAPNAVQGTTVVDGAGNNQIQILNTLQSGSNVASANGKYALAYETDGNIVVYRTVDNAVVWSSGTTGNPGGVFAVQGDGNVVGYRSDGGPYWASGTNGQGPVTLRIQNDGRLSLYANDGTQIWSVGGSG